LNEAIVVQLLGIVARVDKGRFTGPPAALVENTTLRRAALRSSFRGHFCHGLSFEQTALIVSFTAKSWQCGER